MLTFDEAAHAYFWDGQRVPNVTSILSPLVNYSMIPPDVLETARQKGVAVHKMVELDAKGDLDEDTLPDWMRPALAQWRKFVAESGFTMLESEYRVYHQHHGYAGTLDLLGTMRGETVLLDVKRSLLAGPVIGIQLAAYLEAYCAQEKSPKNAKRYALKLSEAGPYKLEPFTDGNDYLVFMSLLAIHRWKEKYAK